MEHDLTETDPEKFKQSIRRQSDRERETLAWLRKVKEAAVIDLTEQTVSQVRCVMGEVSRYHDDEEPTVGEYPIRKNGGRWSCEGPFGLFHARTKREAERMLRDTGGRLP